MLVIDNAIQTNLLDQYAAAESVLFLLDYDGCLVPFAPRPEFAMPDSELLDILQQLAASRGTDVYIVSGRDGGTLNSWLGHLPIGLVAEHGAAVQLKGIWYSNSASKFTEWMGDVERMMNVYVLQCAGSFVEKKQSSIAWHYRNADEGEGYECANDLYNTLNVYAADTQLTVLSGHKVIEVKNATYNKGTAARALANEKHYDLIIAIGDDKTDEDMFAQLSSMQHAVTIKVGVHDTKAKYRVYDIQMVRAFLRALALNVLPDKM